MKKLRKVLAVVTALVLSFNLLSVVSVADDEVTVVASGTFGADGDNLTWVYTSDWVLTISGTGEMGDLQDNQPWYLYKRKVWTIVINDGVTSIGDYAFYECDHAKSVTIPESVTIIGSHAFHSCNLESIEIPSSVTTIGSFAFRACSFTEVVIPEGVKTINTGVFYDCNALETVTIPDSVTSLGGQAFKNCYKLTDINLPSGLSKILYDTFDNCYSLSTITIPDGVVEISNIAFMDCTSLTSIELTNSVTRIGTKVFYNCSSLTDIYFYGTEEEWNQIEIESGNECLLNAIIHYLGSSDDEDDEQPEEDDDDEESDDKEDETDYSEVFSTFNYQSSITGETESYNFFYSDSWFFNNPYTTYQPELVQMSIRVAMAAFAKDDHVDNSNILNLYSQLGFDKITSSYPEPEYDTIGYTIGSKIITSEYGETATLIAVAIRGGGYGIEWGGNFRITSVSIATSRIECVLNHSSTHTGFAIAANTVLEAIQDYTDGIEGNIKIWICGYSRAAATANLVGASLIASTVDDSSKISISGLSQDGVYTFCFECPQNTTSSDASLEIYDSIINIVNPIDFVTKVAPSSWEFTRYGTTLYLPSSSTTSSYYSLYKADMQKYYQYIKLSTKDSSKSVSELTTEGSSQAAIYDKAVDTLANAVQTKTVPQFVGSGVLLNVTSKAINVTSKVSWSSRYEELQDYLMEELANTLGGGVDYSSVSTTELVLEIAEAILRAGSLVIDDLGETVDTVMDFLNDWDCISGFASSHYPELCMAWLTSDLCQSYLQQQFYTVYSDTVTINASTYRTVYINCPVDVSVYDDSGTLVAQIISDEVQDIENGVGAYIDSDEQKVLILPTDMEYKVYLTATDSGEVTYTVEQYNFDSGETEKVVSYFQVDVETGDELVGTVENLTVVDEAVYPLTLNNTELVSTVSQTGNDVDEFYVSIGYTDGGTVTGGGTYTVGEYAKVTATADSGYTFTGWYVNDNLVSTDAEYRFLADSETTIIAVFAVDTNSGSGTTTIVTIPSVGTDNDDVSSEDVTVSDPIEDTNTKTEDEGETVSVPEVSAETNPTTGVALSLVPLAIAALAIVSSKRK